MPKARQPFLSGAESALPDALAHAAGHPVAHAAGHPIANSTARPIAHAGAELDARLRAGLLAWFEREKRPLPWRADRDPYRVWISEAMLQQTRVETVVPYFLRFVARFPDVSALASASIEEVLAHWSGLGYYRRARALHAAAGTVVDEMGGTIPRSVESLRSLPGFGPYTAGAVASIAYDEPEPLVDGNVARVLARIFAIDSEPATKTFREATWSHAERLVRAGGEPGAWNQALMELGALVCTPREPKCATCPLEALCRARSEGRVDELPRPKARRAPIDVELQVLVVRERSRILLEQRPPTGRMASMWQLPTFETSPGELLAPSLVLAHPRFIVDEPLGEFRHTITCHKVHVSVSSARFIGVPATGEMTWVESTALDALPRTGMTQKIVKRGWIH